MSTRKPSSSSSVVKDQKWENYVQALSQGGILAERARRAAPAEKQSQLFQLMDDLYDFEDLENGNISYQQLKQFVAQHLSEIQERV